jgi:hypothetical protein
VVVLGGGGRKGIGLDVDEGLDAVPEPDPIGLGPTVKLDCAATGCGLGRGVQDRDLVAQRALGGVEHGNLSLDLVQKRRKRKGNGEKLVQLGELPEWQGGGEHK